MTHFCWCIIVWTSVLMWTSVCSMRLYFFIVYTVYVYWSCLKPLIKLSISWHLRLQTLKYLCMINLSSFCAIILVKNNVFKLIFNNSSAVSDEPCNVSINVICLINVLSVRKYLYFLSFMLCLFLCRTTRSRFVHFVYSLSINYFWN